MESLEEIYQKYARTVYAYLLSRTRNRDLAEELTQETFSRPSELLTPSGETVSSPPGCAGLPVISGSRISERTVKCSHWRR